MERRQTKAAHGWGTGAATTGGAGGANVQSDCSKSPPRCQSQDQLRQLNLTARQAQLAGDQGWYWSARRAYLLAQAETYGGGK
jgi:hypothetical protein